MLKNEIIDLVLSSLNEILLEADTEEPPKIDNLDYSTALIGRRSILDSLGLVSLIVTVEQKLSEAYGIIITIADERAMSQERSPFRTVGTLVDYIILLIKEQKQSA